MVVQYQYKTLFISSEQTVAQIDGILDDLGRDGWFCYHVDTRTYAKSWLYMFRREVQYA